MKLRTFCALLAAVLLLPFLFFAGCVLVLPPQYDETYMGELKYKIENLHIGQNLIDFILSILSMKTLQQDIIYSS